MNATSTRRPRIISILSVGFLFFLADGLPAVSAADLVTSTYQEGVDGYAGTRAASISTQDEIYTDGNGNTTPGDASDQLALWKIPEYEERVLLRFDDLRLPVGADVRSASLQ